ncbi:3-deoxy-7-phosphoheptulonate synthase [Streptomyces sp. HNM0574]|uniref:3-deoxy-7-phosphoheptulonate synthase n=1 Tax=Streptomyces sp. HNM0574 TaxID=2714954 RepID=UPI00146C7BF9|nr:3-deoxy-7-phosphoheptulonate synthase [Streptomyces sp. HNM0574]NLU68813.1 3-deoxy-7-phosphoheptulonate synthase [Streptomyces sp. HNM0574]
MTSDASSTPAHTAPTRPAAQQPAWPDPDALAEVVRELAVLPPLVTEEEVTALSGELAEAARGERLVLHGGDCAERFEDSDRDTVLRKAAQLRGLATRLREGAGAPGVTAVGRIAGQYAKPRSADHEPGPDGRSIPSYRGDAVNAEAPDPLLRVPDPRRLLTAYHSARRALAALRESARGEEAAQPVYASHELLLLEYERALFRKGPGAALATSAHFGWIGERTRGPRDAHADFASAVHNPVGVKLGPATTPDEALALARLLNPEAAEGRLSFIVRMGAERVTAALPPLVRAVADAGVPVVWLCDPMHANTYRAPGGRKTRALPEIRREIEGFVRVLRTHGAHPAGLSLELTPDPVTECVEGPRERTGAGDFPDYRSACDPRLNPEQATAAVDAFLDAR